MNSVKRHPSQEMLAHFFLESDVFKGINISEAVNEFLDKFYSGYDDVIWVVVDDSPSKFEVVSAFSQYEDAEKLESLLPHSRIEGVGLDAPIKLLRAGSQLFDVKLDENGELVSVKKTITFLTGDESENDYANSGLDQFTGINESSFLGLDEEDAVKNAKQSYLDNKYFFDHADDGIDEALDKSNNVRDNDFDDDQEGEEWKKNL